MAVTLPSEDIAASPMGAGGPPRSSQVEPYGRNLAEKTAGVAAGLVKGAGQARGQRGATGFNLDDSSHGAEIFTKARDTISLGKAAALSGWNDGDIVLGRPVDVLQAPDGSILVSDDQSSTIWQISYVGTYPPK